MPYFTNRGIVPLPVEGGGPGGSDTTFDPAKLVYAPAIALSGGNLTSTVTGSDDGMAVGTTSASSGKYYFEITIGTISAPGNNTIGIVTAASVFLNTYVGGTTDSIGMAGSGDIYGGDASGDFSDFGAGDVVGVAVDFDAELIWWRVNGGAWNSSGSPSGGTGGMGFAGLTAGPYCAAASQHSNGDILTANFGATTFANAAPSGFGNFP